MERQNENLLGSAYILGEYFFCVKCNVIVCFASKTWREGILLPQTGKYYVQLLTEYVQNTLTAYWKNVKCVPLGNFLVYRI
jgi:hypothetical protein